MYQSTREFIEKLDAAGELVRIRRECDPNLEIAEIASRTMKLPGGGPALLFENPRGSHYPLAINLYGSKRRMAMALGVDDIQEHASALAELVGGAAAPGGSLWDKLKMLPKLARVAGALPKSASGPAPCQEIVEADVDLRRLPILTCWPEDGGPFITLPIVLTHDPDTGVRNCGMYRMQLLDQRTTGMHWQAHKTGMRHFNKYKERGQKIPVAVVIGGDPALTYAATAPLPDGVDELLLAGFLRRRAVELVPCKTQPIEVPADADFILEGYVDPTEAMIDEGPFGDHTGYYTPRDKYPAFHVTCVTRRRDPIYTTTVVGRPPMEDAWLGKATERLFLPLLRMMLPELTDYNLPVEGVFHNMAIVAIDKQYPWHGRKIMHALWGMGQLMFTKCVIVVDKDVDVHNVAEVAWRVLNNIDPKRDVMISDGPYDVLDHASCAVGFGGKMGVDATAKWKEEGYDRVWPQPVSMSPDIEARVDRVWRELGIEQAAKR
ncbi:MAG: UbiD family decarboxylase associated with menaquinone via futalosine [Myxococcales bacterium]|nr:UbiD family decarboxylase associated with menaquinone via futalosine [Myxococcales bacterium]